MLLKTILSLNSSRQFSELMASHVRERKEPLRKLKTLILILYKINLKNPDSQKVVFNVFLQLSKGREKAIKKGR